MYQQNVRLLGRRSATTCTGGSKMFQIVSNLIIHIWSLPGEFLTGVAFMDARASWMAWSRDRSVAFWLVRASSRGARFYPRHFWAQVFFTFKTHPTILQLLEVISIWSVLLYHAAMLALIQLNCYLDWEGILYFCNRYTDLPQQKKDYLGF